MRLRTLSLDLFGHFTDRRYDFGDGTDCDFHIIYGPNEAGKTTTMEAALRLLYGFPHRDPYDFQHQKANLRLSGVLDIDGKPQTFTRVPSRKAPLLDASGIPIPESALSAHLGGLTEQDYRALLCLDDETIETGGEDIANARGDIGKLLFSAAAGIADLNAVLDQARSEADTLYRKRASTTAMATLKKELADVERAIREKDTTASAWKALKKSLATAQAAETEARATRDAVQARAAEVAILRRALPRLAERDTLADGLAAFVAYPERLDLDPEHLVDLTTRQARAAADLTRLSAAIADTQAALDALTVDTADLALGERLDALDTLRSRHVSETPDLPKRRRALADAQADMARAARDLGAPEGTDPQRLVLSPADLAGLEAAREDLRDAIAAAEREACEVADMDARLTEAQQARDALAASAPPHAAVSDLLTRYEADRLAPAHASAMAALRAATRTRDDALTALTLGAHRFDTLPDAPMDRATAQALAEEHKALTDKADRAEEDRLRALEDAERHAAQADVLTANGPASDAEAQTARAERDALWVTHRIALTEATATAFAQAMARHDQLSDTRLSHANTLAQLREITRSQVDAETRARQAAERCATLMARRDDITERISRACTTAGLPAMVPAALHDWMAHHATATDAQRALEHVTHDHAPVLERADKLLTLLRPLLPLDDPDLSSALDHARALAHDLRSHATRLASAEDGLQRLIADREARRAAHDRVQARAEAARATWEARVATCFNGALRPETLLVSLAPLQTLREHEAHRVQAQRQITAMEADQKAFAEEMAILAGGASDAPLETFDALRQKADAAAAALARRVSLTAQRDQQVEARDAAREALSTIAEEARAISRSFPEDVPTETLDDLRRTLATARDVNDRRSRLAELDRALLADFAVPDLDVARTRLEGLTPAALEAEAAGLVTDLQRAEQAMTEATAARANAQRDLDAVTGDAEIAVLVERRTTLELEIEDTARRYLELDFGLRLADEAIRRYRDTHRSGMMEATERAFGELTNGAYARLLARPEGSGEVLQVIDAQGTAKQVADLSKGTRFQLYLALRAAAYEQLVSQGVTLPFFCDDIFETFDEDRTRAACRLMERIGRSGQAIYLTHHRHVVDIAQEVCAVAPRVHQIGQT